MHEYNLLQEKHSVSFMNRKLRLKKKSFFFENTIKDPCIYDLIYKQRKTKDNLAII